MFFYKPQHSKPLLFLMMLLGTTALLVFVVFVLVRRASSSSTTSTTATTSVKTKSNEAEKNYRDAVQGMIDSYLSSIVSVDTSKNADRNRWKDRAASLHEKLLKETVPARMQMLHLSLVLEVRTALEALRSASGAPSVAAHTDALRAILAAIRL